MQPLLDSFIKTFQKALTREAENLVNVSISRARGKLIIISDVAYFRRMAPSHP